MFLTSHVVPCVSPVDYAMIHRCLELQLDAGATDYRMRDGKTRVPVSSLGRSWVDDPVGYVVNTGMSLGCS